jgi:phosphate transport system protein
MREEYRAKLAEVTRLLVTMAERVRVNLASATTALLSADATVAERVLADDVEVDRLYRQVEEQIYDLLALQQPVASDLRLVVTSLHVGADVERMGDLACHVAKIGLRRAPQMAVPPELEPVIRDMAAVSDRMAAKIAGALESADAQRAAELDRDDDAVDELQRQMYGLLLGTAWRHGVEQAIDGALLSRWYERFADHAVNAGRQVVYLVTGELAGEATSA